MQFIKNFIKEEDGVTAIEYALIAAVLAGVISAAFTSVGTGLAAAFTKIINKIGA
ncbi:Flp family type IVb pilin [Massilia dura]|uniref:Flp family type IVb pilin n=1 Tax=Pseudoduganella dura TaxID=321982 RepID=A0A6I3XID5_9BURK|nr:Flp family type IVb pilin [Pseudoduganella dura]MUI11455.1 Flp family type IVb pilin [Pseudoduganella dura]GGX97604.1 hypothetical protein GCM10007386_30740 [Pseudoduganella dura]